MNLRDIAAVSGKSGLFKVVKPTRNGVILESIDAVKARQIANASSKVSILNEISIYTTTAEGTIPLEKVFSLIWEKYNSNLPVNSKSSEHELRDFILEIVPDYDSNRVYFSDLKKLATWYGILAEFQAEIFTVEENTEETSEESSKAVVAESAPAPTKKVTKSGADMGAAKAAKPAKSPTVRKTSTVRKSGA